MAVPQSPPKLSPSQTSPPSSPTRNSNIRAGGKPKWLLAIYVLFGLSCLNAARTYRQRQRLVQTALAKSDGTLEVSSSAGAEQHVISANYGSSMYGGGIHTSHGKTRKTPNQATRIAKLENINPKPSDGSKDMNLGRLQGDFGAFSFYAMTDTPYTDWQEKRLRSQMADLRDYVKAVPERNITFGVHLGNTQKPSNTLCAEAAYERIAALIAKGPRPTLVVPGNNDWYDCPRRSESFTFFMKHFGPSYASSHWHTEHFEVLNVTRSDDNPELFVMYYEGILFIGIHLIDAPDGHESNADWDNRLRMNKQWLAESVENYFSFKEIRGSIILGHGKMSPRTRPFFTSMADYFVNITTREELPVMYLHGDGLTYQVDRTLGDDMGWQNYYDVQVHQSGLADPFIVDVAAQRRGNVVALEEESDTQTTLGDGVFRIDRRQGVYADPMDIKKKKRRNE